MGYVYVYVYIKYICVSWFMFILVYGKRSWDKMGYLFNNGSQYVNKN